jgi:uncharacterized protein (DUF488 family)
MENPFHTIGHSTRPIEEFVALLHSVNVTRVVDVRTVPRSRTNPQYNSDTLAHTLMPFRIGYEHHAALGGLRGKNRDVPPDVNAMWRNQSFHNYADYAMNETFHGGLAHLRELGRAERCAIMCSEAVWWRCHRRIIADYLLAAGDQVFHILGAGNIAPAHLTDGARPNDCGALTYPRVP